VSSLEEDFARCEEITRAEARNFSYGIRLLDAERRSAMSALYAFARLVDDIGDGPGSHEEKASALGAVHEQLDGLGATGGARSGDPVIEGAVARALAATIERYSLPVGALHELVEGCEMDNAAVHYEDFDDLVRYCRCVAGSIGRLSLAIFGSAEPERASDLADTLGIALQVTNILRDIVEDREVMGRVYLPAKDLARFGCAPDASGPVDALCDLVRFEAARASVRYAEGLQLLPLLDRRSAACVGAMAGIYRRLLIRIERRPESVLERRVSLPTWEKALVAAGALLKVGA
jgi:15-cis-phytoene synthase